MSEANSGFELPMYLQKFQTGCSLHPGQQLGSGRYDDDYSRVKKPRNRAFVKSSVKAKDTCLKLNPLRRALRASSHVTTTEELNDSFG